VDKRALLASPVTSLLALGGCGDDGGGGDGLIDAGPGTDTGPICTTDSECDDGAFCNGAEFCMPGASGADAMGCPPVQHRTTHPGPR